MMVVTLALARCHHEGVSIECDHSTFNHFYGTKGIQYFFFFYIEALFRLSDSEAVENAIENYRCAYYTRTTSTVSALRNSLL